MEWLLLPLALILTVSATGAAIGWCVLITEAAAPVKPGLVGAAAFSREAVARALFTLLTPAGLTNPAPRPGVAGPAPQETLGGSERPPVILVPGFGRNRACLLPMAAWLRARGWRWVWAINNGPAREHVPALADRLGRRVEHLLAVTGAEQVDLVCHSLGGVIAAWYMQRGGGEEKVRRLVTLGTPWSGTRLAAFGWQPATTDLLPGSAVMAELAPPGPLTTAIWSASDPVIIPSASAAPEGAVCVEIPGLGHAEMLVSRRAFEVVEQALMPTRAALRLIEPDAGEAAQRAEGAP